MNSTANARDIIELHGGTNGLINALISGLRERYGLELKDISIQYFLDHYNKEKIPSTKRRVDNHKYYSFRNYSTKRHKELIEIIKKINGRLDET